MKRVSFIFDRILIMKFSVRFLRDFCWESTKNSNNPNNFQLLSDRLKIN